MIRFKQKAFDARRSVLAGAAGSLLAAVTGAVLLATAPARAAAPPADVPWVAVSYGDLNLATERGARTLFERIRIAAGAVCPAADNRDLSRLEMRGRCVRQAVARAVRQVGSPRLAAVLSERSRHG